MPTHAGSLFPVPDTLSRRGHRVSCSPFPCLDPQSFVLVPCSGPSSPRSFVPSFLIHRFITPSPPSGKEASLTLGIIYTIIFNTLVRGVPVLKTRNSLNLFSTERGGTKALLKILTMRRGPPLVCLVQRPSCPTCLLYLRNPQKFLQVRWDASPNPHYYTRGTRLRVCPVVFGQPVFRSIRS